MDNFRVELDVLTDGKASAIDLGLINCVLVSDRLKCQNPKPFNEREKNLKHKQRQLSCEPRKNDR